MSGKNEPQFFPVIDSRGVRTVTQLSFLMCLASAILSFDAVCNGSPVVINLYYKKVNKQV